jgi:lysophospholipase
MPDHVASTIDHLPLVRQIAPAVPALPERFLEPPGFAWGEFVTPDGARLRWGSLAAEGSWRADCVLVGGFTECIEKYFETIRDLAARGLSVWTFDWRGQGGSERPPMAPSRPRARIYDRDAADLAAFCDSVVPRRGKRVLIAHSMGGAMAMLALAERPDLFDAAVLSAPMLGVAAGATPSWVARTVVAWMTLTGLGSWFVPGGGPWRYDPGLVPATSRLSNCPTRCRVLQEWFAVRSDLIVDGATYGWADAAFRVTYRMAEAAFLARIKTPILIGSAGVERFVDPAAHRFAASRLPHATLVDLPHSKHEPFLECDSVRDRWLAAIDDFLDHQIGKENDAG